MNRLNSLFESATISILRFDHTHDDEQCSDGEEVCPAYAINFVESGSFQLGIQNKQWTLSEGATFLSRPGAVHRYRHLDGLASDVCVSTRYSPDLIAPEEIDAVQPGKRFNGPAPPTNRLAFLQLGLRSVLMNGDPLTLESWACECLAALRDAPTDCHRRLYRARQLRWYAERVDAAREILNRRHAEAHSLVSLARGLGMSTFQFARIFRELTGSPPHRYLLNVRLERALQLLLDGTSVTESCFVCGFSNLSHFIRSFRRRFGCTPSRVTTDGRPLRR